MIYSGNFAIMITKNSVLFAHTIAGCQDDLVLLLQQVYCQHIKTWSDQFSSKSCAYSKGIVKKV